MKGALAFWRRQLPEGLSGRKTPWSQCSYLGAVFWEVSSTLGLLLPSSKRSLLLIECLTPGRKWCILEQVCPRLSWETPVLSKCCVVSDVSPSWVNSALSQCCFSHIPCLHCFWLLLLLLLYYLYRLLLPSCSKSLFSEFLTKSYILIFYKKLSHVLFWILLSCL